MKKIYCKIKNLISTHYLYLTFVLFLSLKAFLMNFLCGMKISTSIIWITLSFPMLLFLPFLGKKRKRHFILANFLYFIFTLLIYANFVYYQYATNFLSIYQIENLKYASEINASLKFLIHFKDILIFWTDNILLMIVSFLLLRKRVTKKEQSLVIRRRRNYGKYAYFIFCLFFVGITFQKVDADFPNYMYNKTLLVENISIFYYHLEDIKQYVASKLDTKIDYQSLENYYEQNQKDKKEETSFAGIAKDNNVIVIQLESISNFLIDKTINGKEITPNLNKFYSENIYCSQMYNQGLGTTADSEHTLSTSLYPLENGEAFQKYNNNKWNDIYSVLSDNGYYTAFMHPNVSTFWNRFEIYQNSYGTDEYNDIYSFEDNGEMAGEFFSDEQFLVQSFAKIQEYKQPFYVMDVAISSHIPFSLEGIKDLDKKITIDVSDIEDQPFADYLLACNFVDYSFGQFLDLFNESDLTENTILVVYGDHGASIQNSDEISKLFAQNNLEYLDTTNLLKDVHIPFGMKIPGVEGFVVENVVSKLDIKPTILGLLGIEDNFSLGENIFSGKDYSFIKGLGFVTNDTYYLNGDFINRKTNEKIQPDDYLVYLTQKMDNDMILSDNIIKHNLIRKYTETNKITIE